MSVTILLDVPYTTLHTKGNLFWSELLLTRRGCLGVEATEEGVSSSKDEAPSQDKATSHDQVDSKDKAVTLYQFVPQV